MPRSDSALRLLALTALSMMPGLASALCEPLAASAQRTTGVMDVSLDDANTLLALDGSRIRSWLPGVAIDTGARATAIIWAERVDWSVYAAAPDARIGVTMLRWESGADGRRHLCGIARYSASAVQEARESGVAALPAPHAETRFYYDASGRLTGYEERSRAWDGRRNPPARFCLRYDAHGWLAELGANDCAAASRPVTRYVHDEAGRLLRTISYQEKSDDAFEVVTHDVQGREAQRYLRQRKTWSDETPVLGLPYRASPNPYAVLVLPGPAWQAPALDSYHYDWTVVQPRKTAEGTASIYAAKRDPAQVLAKGTSDSNGQFLMSAAQRKRIWDAAGRTPGGVQWLWAPGQTYTLLQAMPAAQWASCIDPENRKADACGTP
ncbi:hypothetical protein AXYL_01199 [Achromobacter xylosoxidans A8]|uniref:Uncharacterized protein n=1 Tax=Achromobacter xylosoxidans (strain A8) TaxID=762376 RepID=E3HLY6_ACHXA|nr:hypothetical protein [Achromobacter xylosoxidans]ADP14540.1 hypothetical protein AXYL_01199 [Achromobacter xylosoxidans A8]